MYIFSIITSFFLLNTIFPSHVLAACPASINTSDVTITTGESCTVPAGFSYIIDKADTVDSTVNTGRLNLSGGSITISNTSNLTTGSIIPSGGSIIIQNGGVIKVGNNDTVSYVVDSDADGYTPSLTTIYSSAGTGRRRLALLLSTTLLDCFDTNANVRPGSSYCGSTHRGDGSYDYNCSNTETKCGTTYNRATTGSTSNFTDVCGSCNNCNVRCCGGTSTIYNSATINCGQVGGVCTRYTGCTGGSCSRSIGQMCAAPNNACENYSGSGPTCTSCDAISTGTQTCQ